MGSKPLNRREFLRKAGIGAAVAVTPVWPRGETQAVATERKPSYRQGRLIPADTKMNVAVVWYRVF